MRTLYNSRQHSVRRQFRAFPGVLGDCFVQALREIVFGYGNPQKGKLRTEYNKRLGQWEWVIPENLWPRYRYRKR